MKWSEHLPGVCAVTNVMPRVLVPFSLHIQWKLPLEFGIAQGKVMGSTGFCTKLFSSSYRSWLSSDLKKKKTIVLLILLLCVCV